MNSDRHTDFLLMMIFVLASVCFTRWLYLETPTEMFEAYRQAQVQTEEWTPPFQ
jgi:hypothetical protein